MDGAATLARYGAEMTKAGLLPADVERRLARAIKAGRRAASAVVAPGDGEGALQVQEAIRAGIDARQRLVTSNLGWVISLARRAAGSQVSLDELLQAGVIGLILAAEHFDPDRGRFTTYATFLVRQEMNRAIVDAGPGLRLRLEVRREAARVRAAAEELRSVLGRFPTNDEIAATTGMTAAAVRRVLPVTPVPDSIDDEARPVADVLEDPEARVEEAVLARARAEAARRLLGSLKANEARVVRLRFGLDDGEVRNRAEVGRVLHISRERVRQIEVAALDRLKREAEGLGLVELVG